MQPGGSLGGKLPGQRKGIRPERSDPLEVPIGEANRPPSK